MTFILNSYCWYSKTKSGGSCVGGFLVDQSFISSQVIWSESGFSIIYLHLSGKIVRQYFETGSN